MGDERWSGRRAREYWESGAKERRETTQRKWKYTRRAQYKNNKKNNNGRRVIKYNETNRNNCVCARCVCMFFSTFILVIIFCLILFYYYSMLSALARDLALTTATAQRLRQIHTCTRFQSPISRSDFQFMCIIARHPRRRAKWSIYVSVRSRSPVLHYIFKLLQPIYQKQQQLLHFAVSPFHSMPIAADLVYNV